MNVYDVRRKHGVSLVEVVVICMLILVVALVLLPVFASQNVDSHKMTCMNNLKETTVALIMYYNDYDAVLPSSVLRIPDHKGAWNKMRSAEFCSQVGQIPPSYPMQPRDIHWVQLLYPHMRNKDIIWCPSDATKETQNPRSLVSYIFKPAVERAWYESYCPIDPENPQRGRQLMCFRKEGDFEFVADQIVFFERAGWHSNTPTIGWQDGVKINAAFLDGHVRAVRLKDAIGCNSPRNASELATCLGMDGEPLWYNLDFRTNATGKGKWFDPRIYYDQLP